MLYKSMLTYALKKSMLKIDVNKNRCSLMMKVDAYSLDVNIE